MRCPLCSRHYPYLSQNFYPGRQSSPLSPTAAQHVSPPNATSNTILFQVDITFMGSFPTTCPFFFSAFTLFATFWDSALLDFLSCMLWALAVSCIYTARFSEIHSTLSEFSGHDECLCRGKKTNSHCKLKLFSSLYFPLAIASLILSTIHCKRHTKWKIHDNFTNGKGFTIVAYDDDAVWEMELMPHPLLLTSDCFLSASGISLPTVPLLKKDFFCFSCNYTKWCFQWVDR